MLQLATQRYLNKDKLLFDQIKLQATSQELTKLGTVYSNTLRRMNIQPDNDNFYLLILQTVASKCSDPAKIAETRDNTWNRWKRVRAATIFSRLRQEHRAFNAWHTEHSRIKMKEILRRKADDIN